MAFPLTTSEVGIQTSLLSLGNVWTAATQDQRLDAVATAEGLWKPLPWRISPFDSSTVSNNMIGLLMVHAQHVLENENRPIWPEGMLEQIFLSGYLQNQAQIPRR